jgi:hypothetical protein
LPPFPEVADKYVRFERFTYLQALQSVPKDGTQGLKDMRGVKSLPTKADPKHLAALRALDWGPALRNGNQWFDRLAAALRMRDREARAGELERFESDLRALAADFQSPWRTLRLVFGAKENFPKQMGEMFIALLLPIHAALVNRMDRSEQNQRSLQVAFALAAFQHDHGKYPAKLSELAPRYIAQVPNDIYSGRDLIYRPSETGYLLYSLGVNGEDDEGRFFDDELEGDDLAIRMPLPELKADR